MCGYGSLVFQCLYVIKTVSYFHFVVFRLCCAGLVVVGMVVFYWGEAQVKWIHKDWDSLLTQTLLYVPSVLHIVYTNVLATVYRTVAQSLTEYGE